MKNFRLFLAATTAVVGISAITSVPAYAQSTGSIEAEDDVIVVTGARTNNGIEGIIVPDAGKARGILTADIISRQAVGQSILNTINLVPGVNFTNSDAYGSSGGNLRIRGFDGNRISLTFDGIPLNDSGNYAIFSNQQLDPELIKQVNVNLGATDVDSPTASAAGGTVNYLTITPSETLSASVSGSYGEENYRRIFALVQSGNLNASGTRMFLSASYARYDKFKGPGEIYKRQINAKIYQPIGDNGDFVSIAGHYNQNRNNFYRNPSVTDMRTLFGTTVVPAAGSISAATPLDLGNLTSAQEDALFNFENDATCATPFAGCTNYFKVRINPSNTGNVRLNSKFTLAENVTFTLDGSYQYVLANGGGFTASAENATLVRGSQAQGVDFNNDGDRTDSIGFYTPNTTNTRRYTAIASLIYDFAPDHRVRFSYTFDRARHRQTGEWGFLTADGGPENVFGGRNGRPVLNADQFKLQQRDRLSIALLNQLSAQYIGKFFDETLRVEAGVRMPFFERNLNQYCYTQTGGSGFATCTSQLPSQLIIVPANQTGNFPSNSLFAPFKADYSFSPILPSVSLTYKLDDALSVFSSYSKGFSAPRTDNLYRAPRVTVDPETTNSFDLGLRYTTSRVQAQVAGWYIGFKNRIVTSFDQSAGISVDRNVGKVDGYGIDANVAVKVADPVSVIAFASYNHSELKDNIEIGRSGTTIVFAPTAGKRVTETPEWTFGARTQVRFGPFEAGAQAKYTGSRFATDVNDVKVSGYTLVDLDARLDLEQFGLGKTYLQVNVQNLFDTFYFGNISTQINHGTISGVSGANPNFSVGAPRTVMGSLVVGF